MADAVPFAIGARTRCRDGQPGRVSRVVIDPVRGRVTHLIVEPEHREGLGRLVPVGWARPRAGEVELECTGPELESLKVAEDVRFLPGEDGRLGYDPEQALLWPYFGGNTTVPVVVDSLPAGDVAVQRGERVDATDGPVGEVEGLVVDELSHRATHLVLGEGHLFGRRDVAIPLSAVRGVDEVGVRLSLTKEQVGELPEVEFRRSPG